MIFFFSLRQYYLSNSSNMCAHGLLSPLFLHHIWASLWRRNKEGKERSLLITHFIVSLTSLRKIHRVLLLLPIKPVSFFLSSSPLVPIFIPFQVPVCFWPYWARGRDGAVTSAFFSVDRRQDGLVPLRAFHFGVSLTHFLFIPFFFSF